MQGSKTKKNDGKHKYTINKSILYGLNDEYTLSMEEYYSIYSFYVTYSMCANQSGKKRTLIDYGWDAHTLKSRNEQGKELYELLKNVLLLSKDKFYFYDETTESLTCLYEKNELQDGKLLNYDVERGVVGKTGEGNKYLKLFYRIRNAFAHGRYVLKFSSKGEKMVIIQDNDQHNVTARLVLKLSSILGFIAAVDIKNKI